MTLSNFISGAAGGATVAIVIKGVDDFSSTFNKATSTMQKFSKLASVAVASMAVGLTAFGVSSVRAAANAEVISKQFKSMTNNSEDFLKSLNKATQETVSDFDLMASANKALMLGIDQNRMSEFFEKAAILGQVSGRSVTEAVEDITLGVGRQSKLILDNLGIIVDAEAAYDSYAKTIGTTADKLTEAQKKTAFLDATMKGMEKTIRDNGLVFETGLNVQLAQAKKQFEEFKVSVGQDLAPEISKLTASLIENKDAWGMLGNTVTGILTTTVEQLANVIIGIKTWVDSIKIAAMGMYDIAAAYEAGGGGFKGIKAIPGAAREAKNREDIYSAGYSLEEADAYKSMTVEKFIEMKQEHGEVLDEMKRKQTDQAHWEQLQLNDKTAKEQEAAIVVSESSAIATNASLEYANGIVSVAMSAKEAAHQLALTKFGYSSDSQAFGSSKSIKSYAVTGATAAAIHGANLNRGTSKSTSTGNYEELGGGGYTRAGVESNVALTDNGTWQRVNDIRDAGGNVSRTINNSLNFYNQVNPVIVSQQIMNQGSNAGVV